MARTYATIDAGLWDDPDFLALSAGAQRTYFMLITQKEITACGTLALTLRRWSKTCLDSDLDLWLSELVEARFVLLDEDTEELLVRTFVKWDGGYKHAKRLMAVVSFARAIRSPQLRHAVASEMEKLGVSIGTTEAIDRDSSPTPVAIDSRRSVVTEVGNESTPHSTNQNQERGTVGDADDPPSMFCSKHPNGTEEPCGACGTAKLRYLRWVKTQPAEEAARRRDSAHEQTASLLAEQAEAARRSVPRPDSTRNLGKRSVS